MSRQQRRKANLERIRALNAGKITIRPLDTAVVLWNTDGPEIVATVDGKTFRILHTDLADFEQRMGGRHLVMQKAPNCDPLDPNPEKQTIGKRIKRAASKFFNIEAPKQTLPPTILPEVIAPVAYSGSCGGSMGELKDKFHTDKTGDLEQLLNIYIR